MSRSEIGGELPDRHRIRCIDGRRRQRRYDTVKETRNRNDRILLAEVSIAMAAGIESGDLTFGDRALGAQLRTKLLVPSFPFASARLVDERLRLEWPAAGDVQREHRQELVSPRSGRTAQRSVRPQSIPVSSRQRWHREVPSLLMCQSVISTSVLSESITRCSPRAEQIRATGPCW